MERFNALGRGTQIMLVAGVLLFIDLFLRWQEVEFDLGPLGEGSAGVSAWDNFLGIVLGLLVIVLLAWIVVRLASVDIPLPISTAMTAALLGVLIVFFAVLKNLVDDYSTIWSYIGVGLAIIILIGAFQTVQEAGGIDTLKSEIPSTGSSSTQTAAAPPPPPPPPPPDTTQAAPPVEPAPPTVPDQPTAPEEPRAAPDVTDDDRRT
jgi:uncharacterized membrane protein YhdT